MSTRAVRPFQPEQRLSIYTPTLGTRLSKFASGTSQELNPHSRKDFGEVLRGNSETDTEIGEGVSRGYVIRISTTVLHTTQTRAVHHFSLPNNEHHISLRFRSCIQAPKPSPFHFSLIEDTKV